MLHRVGGEKLVRKMTALFFQNAPERLAEIQQSLSLEDRSAGERAAHSLKSSAGQLGAIKLQQLCDGIENALHAADVGTVRDLLLDAEAQLDFAISHFQSQLHLYDNPLL